jgi:hypothetical protein
MGASLIACVQAVLVEHLQASFLHLRIFIADAHTFVYLMRIHGIRAANL